MRAVLEKNGECLIESVEVAASPWARMKGLLGRRQLDPGSALLLSPCSSVHTFFMRFSLDLIFLDGDRRVVRVARNVAPYRMVSGGMRARETLEVSSGWLSESAAHQGDRVILLPEADRH